MAELTEKTRALLLAGMSVAGTVVLLYAPVLVKLGRDWWTDENYSHGLLVPFVIGFIVWKERDLISRRMAPVHQGAGWAGIATALLLLLGGTLAAELFTQRIAFVVMLAGLVVYFLGSQVLKLMAVPFALLILAIPIPQIVFNRIAIPLQMWASGMAVWGIRLFDVPTLRKGNVIDILPDGGIQAISLEVVEACSGIRSLMTLVTIGLILGYFTRREEDGGGFANLTRPDLARTILLMIAAVPAAVLTNAARVAATGVMTYHYGKAATGATVHEVSGWAVYVLALALLIGLNVVLRAVLPVGDGPVSDPHANASWDGPGRSTFVVCGVLLAAAIGINALAAREEIIPPRTSLASLPTRVGEWTQRGSDMRFSKESEDVLRATDYSMREYTSDDGRVANVYVGYYATQRTGATYHSPQNCLPGAGWVLGEHEVVAITSASGRTFNANRYIIVNGVYREVMLYWYQGRGRTETSEFRDKLNTVLDSVMLRRSDGAMIRVMTSVGDDQTAAFAAASGLAGAMEDELEPFLPE